MSQISQLKENADNNANLVELLSVLFPDLQTKYYELIIRLIKYDSDKSKPQYARLSPFQLIAMAGIKDFVSRRINLDKIMKFVDFNERNLIKENDLSKYKSFDYINQQVLEAEKIEEIKRLESEVVKLYEDDEWMIIKPVTHRSSIKYGYGTKWCTAMENQSNYFSTYSREGILIYCINKKTNKKVAMYKKLSDGDLSFWDSYDKKVDSMATNLPDVVMKVLREEFTNNKPKPNSELKVKEVPVIPKVATKSYDVFGDSTTPIASDGRTLEDTYRRARDIMSRM